MYVLLQYVPQKPDCSSSAAGDFSFLLMNYHKSAMQIREIDTALSYR